MEDLKMGILVRNVVFRGIQVKETIDDPYDPRVLCQNYCNFSKKNKRFGIDSEEDGDIFPPVSVDLSPSVREKQRYNRKV